MTAIHIPYDPDQVIGDFGWLWLDDGPMGPDWHLIQTIQEDGEDGDLRAWFVGDGDGHTSDCAQADNHKGAPYLSALKPSAEPGKSAALEVTVRLASGASMSHSFGDAKAAAQVEAAVFGALRLGRDQSRAEAAEAERDRIAAEWADVSQRNYQRAKAAEAEAARLRVALMKIEEGFPAGTVQLGNREPLWRDVYRDAQMIARVALKGGDG